MASEFTALLASISVALFAVYGWLGLRYSTPLTATIVSLAAHTATLGAVVALTGAIRRYAQVALMVFVFLGLQKVGASRSQPLRNSYPLWSAALAIAFMDEYAGLLERQRAVYRENHTRNHCRSLRHDRYRAWQVIRGIRLDIFDGAGVSVPWKFKV